MILQALYEYYERKSSDPESGIAPIGFEWKPIPFIIAIDTEGNLKSLKDTREKDEKRLIAKTFLVPQSVGRSGSNSWKTTFLLWDHWGYVLGYPKGDSLKERKKRSELLISIANSLDELKKENTELLHASIDAETLLEELSFDDIAALANCLSDISENYQIKESIELSKSLHDLKKAKNDGSKQLETFIGAVNSLPDKIKKTEAVSSIIKFYKKKEYKKVIELENWMDCAGINGANITFQIEGENSLILSRDSITEYQKEQALLPESGEDVRSLCLITGKDDYIQRIHNTTPIPGGQPTGKLVGFQKSSGFDSFGREQGFNAPVGIYAQTAYTTALNTLVKSDTNKVMLGDTTVLFWSEKDNILEKALPLFFTKPKDDPDKGVLAVKQLYKSISSGKPSTDDDKKFFVLGLSPNEARISVRYWISGTVAMFAANIIQHFDDLKIVHGKNDLEFFPLSSLLSHTALDYKLSNVVPILAGQVTEAVLKGIPYPQTLLFAAIRRIRAEQHITRVRAAIIKACINRFNRYHNKKEEIAVSLDKTNMNPAYRLGRLFAVLERIQKNALNIETIRERYYGAFSSTPVTVYPQLMKLKNHHLAKLEKGRSIYYERIIGEIIDGLDGSGLIPRQFSLEEQGRFAVGYYHQRQDFYKKKEPNNDHEINEENEL